jgi:hypothetical protein
MNDIVSFPFENYNPAAYEQALKDEFDQLYEEGAHKRRMMVISLHRRISGHANRVRVLDRFLSYAKTMSAVWFARKDDIAAYALEQRAITPVYDRGAPAQIAFRYFGGRSVAADARPPTCRAWPDGNASSAFPESGTPRRWPSIVKRSGRS